MNNIEQIALYRLICYIEVPFKAYLTVCKAIVYDRNKNTLFTVLANIWKCTSCNRQNVESKCNSSVYKGQFAQCYSSLDVLNKVYFKCYVVTSIKWASSNNSYRLEVKGQGISWKFFSNLWSPYMARCTQYNIMW
jgi:hypothetical protein